MLWHSAGIQESKRQIMSNKDVNIVIVDDNVYYNKLMNRQLQNNIHFLPSDYKYNISSFFDADWFMNKLDPKTDFVILDYFLDNGITAKDLIDKIKAKAKSCKIIIMSRSRNKFTAVDPLKQGADYFIHKEDTYALPRTFYALGSWISDQLAKNI